MKTTAFSKTAKFFSLVSAAFLLASLTTCKNNIGAMLDNYNQKFIPTKDIPEQPSPGDSSFYESEMLGDRYTVGDNETLNLYAPPNCKDYKWTVIDPFEEVEENKIIKVKYLSGFSETDRRLVIYIPTSGLKRGVYKLYLNVTGNNNRAYEDSCDLIIYQHTN